MECRYDNRGFTLIELMVSIAITAIASVAASTILIAGIRYSALVYRQARLEQELVAIDRMLELAVEDAENVQGYHREEENEIKEITNGAIKNPDDLWLVFPKSDGKCQIFYFDKKDRICHSISQERPDEDALDAQTDRMTPLTEHCAEWTIKYDSGRKAFTIEMKLEDGQVTEDMKSYWVLSEKADESGT